MFSKGFIKFNRSFYDLKISHNLEYCGLWNYLLCDSNFTEQEVDFKGKKRKIQPGQRTCTISEIAEFFKVSRKKITCMLSTLEKNNLIKVETSRHCTLVTIINWSELQGKAEAEPEVDKKSSKSVPVNEVVKKPRTKKQPFVPPTKEECIEFFKANQYNSSAKTFFNHYEKVGWVSNTGVKIKNWQVAAEEWEDYALRGKQGYLKGQYELVKKTKKQEEEPVNEEVIKPKTDWEKVFDKETFGSLLVKENKVDKENEDYFDFDF